MRKFPEEIATKQDVENIINHHPEYHKQLKEVLQRAYDEPDTAKQIVSSDTNPKTNEMINIVEKVVTKTKMKYKDLGFSDKTRVQAVMDLNAIMEMKTK